YQARPTEKHIHAVKRIFRYLRGTVNRGLWYPKDSSVALIAFVDADHAGCQDTHRSTSGKMKCQFLDKRLNELMMMVLVRQTENYDRLLHMVMIDMKLLVVEIKTADIMANDVDNMSCSTDVERSKQALVEAYDADKAILDTYGESTILKRRREDDDQEGPFAGSDRGSKRQKEGVHQYITQQMTEAVREAVQIQTDRLQDLLQRENDEFLRNIDENMKKIIKGQVKNQVKEQVSRILPRIEESVNATLEAEVLTRSSHSSRTSYAIAADLSEMELKKILIEKMEGNKSIQREDDDQEGPSAGSNRGSKRQKERGEHSSASTPSKTATEGASRSTTWSQSRQLSASESAFAEEPVQTTCQMEEPPHPPRRPPSTDRAWNKTLPAAQGDAQSWISDLARQTDARSSFNKLLDTHIDLSNFIMNRLNVDTLTPELLAGTTYELMRGSSKSLTELEYHLEEIYKFKEGDLKRLCLQDIEDMLLLLEHCHPEASGRSSTGSGKLLEEAQPYEARHVPTRSEATDETLNDVRNALDDRLKGIRMQYVSNTIWRRGDKDRAAAMIHAIEKMLKTRRIMRSLEKFPLPLIPDNRGRRVISFEHFINNDLEYLLGGASSRKYTTSVTKTKAADYGHIKWIEDLVPCEMWIQQPIDYNKHALWGVSHEGRKHKQFYGYAVNQESARDVYSKRRI
nr:uncharacterized mitochondrial protein AtMg00810-like [Tanacetum cinerariifolium]